MTGKAITVSILISAVVGFIAALAACLMFFFFVYKPAQTAETPPAEIPSEPTPPKAEEFPTPKVIRESDVSELSLQTVYKGFFDDSKCRKTYNELFGDKDGVYSSSSACRLNLTFKRDGSAEKSIAVRRYDSAAKGWRDAEKSVWKAKISDEQFQALAKIIVGSEAFKNWGDGMTITASNSSITVKHAGGTRTPMSNVDEKTTGFLSMMNAFKELDGKLRWEKSQ